MGRLLRQGFQYDCYGPPRVAHSRYLLIGIPVAISMVPSFSRPAPCWAVDVEYNFYDLEGRQQSRFPRWWSRWFSLLRILDSRLLCF